MKPANLLSNVPQPTGDEFFETLVQHPNIKIERIVSHGYSSPKGFWYDQDMNEWVLLLKGRAILIFEGEATQVGLIAGSYMEIPAHKKHRVEWTDPSEDTVWLALYY
jgi:cupin 2 domain-containing protein